MAKKKMTLEQLAERIDNNFAESKKFTSDRFEESKKFTGSKFEESKKFSDSKFDESKRFTKDFTNNKIEELAGMVQGQFIEIQQQFDNVRNDIAGVEKKLNNKIEKEIEGLSSKMHVEFSYIHDEINDIKIKLNQLSKRTLEDDDAIGEELTTLQKRVTILEKQLKELKSTHA